MLPDTGERYLSTYLFDDVDAGSDDEWLASLDKSSSARGGERTVLVVRSRSIVGITLALSATSCS